MPARLRPTAPIAADAVLVGDPGRALMLAQELLEEPKMSNHARGLWGYSGLTPAGRELTIQATGMGGPSAALVLADLAELGVRRAIRVGTCVGARARAGPRRPAGGRSRPTPGAGGGAGEAVLPDPSLTARLREELGAGDAAGHRRQPRHPAPRGGAAPAPARRAGRRGRHADRGALRPRRDLGVAVAAVLIVAESAAGDRPLTTRRSKPPRDAAGAAPPRPFRLKSNPKVEG